MIIRTRFATATAVAAALALAAPQAAPSAAAVPAAPGARSAPSDGSGPGVPAASRPAPLRTSPRAVPGRYIVTLDKRLDAGTFAEELDLKPSFVYGRALNGFAVPLTLAQLKTVRNALGVAAVEEDSVVSVASPAGAAGALSAPAASWGLDRIDQRTLPLDGGFTTAGDGTGVDAYILDTGIEYGHAEFGGRASLGYDAVGDGRAGADCQGHGTHVAGTVAGATYGVARGARLFSVRVLGCDGNGSWSGVLAGMDWIARNARRPAVMNASLGGPSSEAVDRAATSVAAAGVLPVVAAGNSAVDACDVSPARAEGVVTVGATDRQDQETSFSNFGACLRLYAPGQAIVSAKLGGGGVARNGTSMAAPHVAGVAALHLQAHPEAGVAEVTAWLDETSTKGVLKNVSPSSPDKLLFTDAS
ncbi:S8 family serine peptidase [Streptomyces sp. NPDC008121]|uniref:S8 family peptidase n=1 Tax=Streptomyces sp. NPDC008121 TaxID=3364809 RepID=UPI0036EAB6DC